MTARFFRAKGQTGFTLLELVIVLGITGLIFGGLWGLISSGGSQLQAQTAAQQYRQVIEATRRLLAPGVPQGAFNPATYAAGTSPTSPGGATPGASGDLNISVLTDPAVGLLSRNFAQESPAGSGRYFDAFGHEMKIKVQRMDDSTTKWRYMIYSTPGDAPLISDKVGAQVSSLIGSEGGFIYNADTEGCLYTTTLPNAKTCGAFNSFAFPLADIRSGGTPVDGSGRIATLSYTSDNNQVGALWLMRYQSPAGPERFNTMRFDLDFDTTANATLGRAPGLRMNGNTASLGTTIDATSGGGTLNLAGGKVVGNGAVIWMGADGATTGGGTINMAAGTLDMMQGPINNVRFIRNSNSIDLSSTNGNINMNTGLGVSIKPPTIVTDPVTGQPTVSLDIIGTGRATTFQAGQFIYTSDMEMKENFKTIPNALEKVLMLRGLTYNWKANHAADIGLVAQDVEKVFPELVGSISHDRKGIDYAKIVAPLIEAIRQLKEQNDVLMQKLERLESRDRAR